MGNVLPPHNDIHEMYDLKGSTFGRFLPQEEIEKNKNNAVMKDLNFEKNNKKLQLGPQKRKMFISQLTRDARVNINYWDKEYNTIMFINSRTFFYLLFFLGVSSLAPSSPQYYGL